jgi:hypothetical protein
MGKRASSFGMHPGNTEVSLCDSLVMVVMALVGIRPPPPTSSGARWWLWQPCVTMTSERKCWRHLVVPPE